jgi:UBX domain-containing protein 1
MSSLSPEKKEEILDHFLQLADGLPDKATARHFLEACDYDESQALDAYFESLDNDADADEEDDDEEDDDLYAAPPPRAIPTASSTQQPPSQPAKRPASGPRKPLTGIRTLGDLTNSHGHDDDDDDEDSDHNDLYTGGEKSGLAVHGGQPNKSKNPKNPKDRIEGLLNKARKYVCTYLSERD